MKPRIHYDPQILLLEDDYFLANEERSCQEVCNENGAFCALGQVILVKKISKDIEVGAYMVLYTPLILQIKSAASNIPTCRAIIDSIGSFRPQHFGPLSSAELGSQAFEGGGCTHQGNNNWYQVMRPNDTEPSCDTAPPVGSKWQRVCACTPYFLARKGQSCGDACAENGYSCNLEKVTCLRMTSNA